MRRTIRNSMMTMKRTCHNRIIPLVLSALLVLGSFLAGCSRTDRRSGIDKDSAEDGVYTIYYMNPEGTALVSQSYKTTSEDFEGRLSELLTAFMTPNSTQYRSALPEGVKINSTTTGIGEIGVDFSAEYLSLDSISEILLRGALVSTLLGLRGVDTVRFTVDSQALTINDEEVGAMTKDTFVVADGDAINSYRFETLVLYFPNADGSKLIQELRTIYYSTNVNTERMAAEQLISGPDNPNLIKLTTQGVLVNSITVDGDICTVDFNAEVNNLPFADNPTGPETVLYAFANSIIDSCEDGKIEGVRFLIDGSQDVRFRGEVNLDQTFERNAELIDTSGTSVQKQGTVVDGEEDAPADKGSGEPSADEQQVMMEQEVTEAVG